MARSFPDGFEWGVASAAHQTEGGNWNSDWWDWEHRPGTVCTEPSGDACDSWHRHESDVDLVADLGFGVYRFSVEWARIEPEPGLVSYAALDRYRRPLEHAHARGVRPVVTFNHFTLPRWVAARGGWTDEATVERFGDYCATVTRHLGDLLHRACTINEPDVVAFVGHRLGIFPPGLTDEGAWRGATANLVAAHRAGVDAIRAERGGLAVGLTLSMSDYQPDPPDDPAAVAKRDEIVQDLEDVFLDACGGDDFVGVQTYSRQRIGPHGTLPPPDGADVLVMGYEYWPDALEATIRRTWSHLGGRVPIVVTENGIGTADDDQRVRYVSTALDGVLACLADGIDVRGYTYWCLLDNFEWVFGYGPRFGLCAVDRSSGPTRFARTPKASARWLGEIARSNRLD